jgi:hypothetical protein
MATQVWSGGAGNGTFADNANWVSGTAPGNNDTAIIGATNSTINGAATGFTAITVKVLPGFGGTIGLDTPLTFGSATLIEYAGSGSYANFGCAGTVTAGTFNHTGGKAVVSTGTWTTLINGSGQIEIPAATVVTTFRNVAGTATAGYNATVFTLIESGGSSTIKRSATAATVFRGNLTQQDGGTGTYTLCTTANVHNGATYNKQSGGVDVTVNAYPGSSFTLYGNTGGGGSVAITTLNEYAGSRVNLVVPGLTVTPGTHNRIGAAPNGLA